MLLEVKEEDGQKGLNSMAHWPLQKGKKAILKNSPSTIDLKATKQQFPLSFKSWMITFNS